MAAEKSSKKITKVGDAATETNQSSNSGSTWQPSEDSKSKATTNRVIAIVCWAVAIGLQVWAYFKLQGTVAAAALAIAGLTGTDFNPPSVEEYTEQTQRVEDLNNGINNVYWTKSGKSYHLYETCGYINSNRTTEIFQGTVANARELKKITDLCDRCAGQAEKAKALDVSTE